MTLGEIIQLACQQARREDGDSIAFAASVLRKHINSLWNAHLWKCSLRFFSVAVDPVSNALHAAGQVMLPALVGRVVGARTTENPLIPGPQELWTRTTESVFTNAGTPTDFSILAPVVWAWSSAGGKPWLDGALADVVLPVTFRWIDTSERLREEDAYIESLAGTTPTGTGTVPGSDMVDLLAVTKAVSGGNLYLYDTALTGTLIGTARTTDEAFPLRTRLQLLERPDAATTLTVLAKLALPTLTDGEVSPIPGTDAALMAFVEYSLHRRARQGAAAQSALAEAGQHLEQAQAVELVQEATRYRLVPDNPEAAMSDQSYW